MRSIVITVVADISISNDLLRNNVLYSITLNLNVTTLYLAIPKAATRKIAAKISRASKYLAKLVKDQSIFLRSTLRLYMIIDKK